MSEYQRYEFMTVDRPLTREQLAAVNHLSSHIQASTTHAVIEYQWGDFKHDPIEVLRQYFDGFLYWANWGTPRLAFRFPHGALPGTLVDAYDLEESVTFTQYADFDILDMRFNDLEPPDEWIDYELGSMIAAREELMDGDARALYIVWLAANHMLGANDEEEEYEVDAPPVPPGLATPTAAQHAVADLFRLPEEVLVAAGRHSQRASAAPDDEFAAWVRLLPPERRDDYLVRLAGNEPGLSRALVTELRELGRGKPEPSSAGERVTFATILAESADVKDELEAERRRQAAAAHQRMLRKIHDHQEDYWARAEEGAARGSSAGYDEAATALVELREAAARFDETARFEERFQTWVRPHLRRPALLKRFGEHRFIVPVG
jgi:hypothetical protein